MKFYRPAEVLDTYRAQIEATAQIVKPAREAPEPKRNYALEYLTAGLLEQCLMKIARPTVEDAINLSKVGTLFPTQVAHLLQLELDAPLTDDAARIDVILKVNNGLRQHGWQVSLGLMAKPNRFSRELPINAVCNSLVLSPTVS